jgi:transcriptional regulator with GAF, ATPase, and Fis domain
MTSRDLIKAGAMAAIARACTHVFALCLGFGLLLLPAAARLGMKRTTLAYRIRKLNISCRP